MTTLRELHEEATPPSWTAHDEQHPTEHGAAVESRTGVSAGGWFAPFANPADAALIAAARNALPLLLDVADAARTRERAEEALADAPSSAPEVPRLETERAEAILTIRAALAALDGAA